jgi:hypothetical protein
MPVLLGPVYHTLPSQTGWYSRRIWEDTVTEATDRGQLVKGAAFTEDEYRNINTMDDAIALFQDRMGASVVEAAEEIGDGFYLIEDKDKLVGVPLLLLTWNFNAGDFASTFVSVRAIARFGNSGDAKVVFNDGGTGIRDQLDKFSNGDRPMGGVFVAHGLRKSEYGLNEANEPVKLNDPAAVGKATTYYLDTSK